MCKTSDEDPSPDTRAASAGRALAAIRLVGLFAFGFGVALHFARLGFHPLDGSIVFDAGWRILSGQVPVRDFTTPEAIVPGLMQAAVFAIAGVNWLAYCAHAALLNGLFCLVVYGLLRRFEVAAAVATAYAALTALAFQPPFGVPFPDLHAFFFVGASSLALVVAARSPVPVASLAARAAIPLLLALALLSKPSPTGYAVPLVMAAALLWQRPERSRAGTLLSLAAGSLVVVAAVWLALLGLDVDPSTAWFDLWTRPSRVGSHRIPEFGLAIAERVLDRGFYREGLLLPGLLGATLLAAVLAGPRFWKWLRSRDPIGIERLAMAAGLCAVGLLYRSTALNQPMAGMAFTFAAAGLLHGNPARGPRWFGRARGVARRRVSDIQFHADQAGEPQTPALAFMRYQVNPFYRTTADQLDRVVAFLGSQSENFLLIGDHSILYGITGRPSVSPSLWFHDGLTAPAPGSPAFAAHQRRMDGAVDRFDVGWVVVEGRRTGMFSRLEQYPAIEARIKASGCAPVEIGNFRFYRLGSSDDCPRGGRPPVSGP